MSDAPMPSDPEWEARVEAVAQSLAISRYQNPTSYYMLDEAQREARVQGEWGRAATALEAAEYPSLLARVREAEAERGRYKEALEIACNEGWATGPGAMRGYLATADYNHIARQNALAAIPAGEGGGNG